VIGQFLILANLFSFFFLFFSFLFFFLSFTAHFFIASFWTFEQLIIGAMLPFFLILFLLSMVIEAFNLEGN